MLYHWHHWHQLQCRFCSFHYNFLMAKLNHNVCRSKWRHNHQRNEYQRYSFTFFDPMNSQWRKKTHWSEAQITKTSSINNDKVLGLHGIVRVIFAREIVSVSCQNHALTLYLLWNTLKEVVTLAIHSCHIECADLNSGSDKKMNPYFFIDKNFFSIARFNYQISEY